jgi:hypothetical protein
MNVDKGLTGIYTLRQEHSYYLFLHACAMSAMEGKPFLLLMKFDLGGSRNHHLTYIAVTM